MPGSGCSLLLGGGGVCMHHSPSGISTNMLAKPTISACCTGSSTITTDSSTSVVDGISPAASPAAAARSRASKTVAKPAPAQV